jgi:hypothetical protein
MQDCGGADFGLAKAIDEGLILGPRLLYAGVLAGWVGCVRHQLSHAGN